MHHKHSPKERSEKKWIYMLQVLLSRYEESFTERVIVRENEIYSQRGEYLNGKRRKREREI